MAIITARYIGRCSCGARFARGARVNWMPHNGVVVCPACDTRVMRKTVVEVRGVPMAVTLRGRNGVPVKGIVTVGTAELFGVGVLHVGVKTGFVQLGGRSALANGDLADYIDHAVEAVRIVASEAA